MGETIHHYAIEHVTNSILTGKHGPADEWVAAIADVTRKLNNGFFADADYFFQNYWGKKSPDIYDVVGFILARQDVFKGKTWVCDLRIGEEPGSDSDVEGNNKKLQKLADMEPSLKASARFSPHVGAGADNDGFLEFEDMLFCRMNIDNEVVEERTFSWTLPLEVGTTAASKTLLHIRTSGVARWPYGSKTIRVFLTPERDTEWM